ncbi:MAG: bifunctional diaminohydroxyphosphoribosylaminopyrimidine deaminase/5-amino-6-(5-phosphoribosylamino)uracil reductase RibD, partial [Bdellovibrionota bacterium]
MHEIFLERTLQLAESRRGFCAPNPSVGAVVVKNGKIIAEGFHWERGKPHAEIEALNKIGDEAKGSHLYVSLEPCCHYGKTPPCTKAIIERGIAKVVYGFQDPNPIVCGKGEAQLRAAGVECQFHPTQSISHFYRSYSYWHKTKKPWVTLKIALSFDGKVSGPQGDPVQITGLECQKFTHENRKKSDAILTSAKTIICDNPQLNARIDNEINAKKVYILDRNLSLPLNAKIFKTAQ